MIEKRIENLKFAAKAFEGTSMQDLLLQAADTIETLSAKLDVESRKIAKYEDLEEEGKLLKLPCKVGDTVYTLFLDDGKWNISEMKVCLINIQKELKKNVSWIYLENDYAKQYSSLYEFGKIVFYTREAAENALKEMRERNE